MRQLYLQLIASLPAGYGFAVVALGEIHRERELACLCGQCGTTVAAVASVEQLANILFSCPICKAYNRVAPQVQRKT